MADKLSFETDIDALDLEQLKGLYRRLLASRNGLKEHNTSLSKWAASLNEAVTELSTEGSLVFQAMAEKACVRGHPSVANAVKLFDSISHPQWHREGHEFPKVEWPVDWDFDDERDWSGDADMLLNSPIADALELLDAMKFEVADKWLEHIKRIACGLQDALSKRIDIAQERDGFVPKKLSGPPSKRYDEMDAGELRKLVSALGWMALDLAQDMSFANDALRRDLRAAAYRRVCLDLYDMSQLSIEWGPRPAIDIKTFGDVEAA